MFKKKVFEYNGHQIRKGADLSGADLSGLELGHDAMAVLGSLEGVNFANANLTGANFDGLELNWVNFAGANLTGAGFKKCSFPPGQQHCFSGANLSNATITGNTKSYGCYFTGANLDGATLSGAFIDFHFQNASLRGARISSSTFGGCNFDGANFTSAHFEGKEEFDFYGQDRVLFYNCDLSGAKFHDVSGCACFVNNVAPSAAIDFKDFNGVMYLDSNYLTSLVGHPRYWEYQRLEGRKCPWDANITAPGLYALTPQGFTPAPSFSTTENSSVESKLAEAKQLLEDGLIDQAEHDALRRKILGI